MKITLRRAAALQQVIKDTLRSIALNSQIKINEFQDVAGELAKGRNALLDQRDRRRALYRALFDIRCQVGLANKPVIDNCLTEIAILEREIEDLQTLCSQKPQQELRVLEGFLNKIRKDQSERATAYHYDPTVETGVLTDRDLEQLRRELQDLRRSKQRLQDTVLSLNVTTEITLETSTVAVLEQENLV